jgi:pyruvyltransferase
VISPQQPLEDYLCALLSCRIIVSSSLHGLIFAHAYGLPAIWIKLSDRLVGGEFKFHDHYAFMEVDALEIPRWNFDQTIAQNLAKATCPPIPAIAKAAPDMLRDVLEANGHA